MREEPPGRSSFGQGFGFGFGFIMAVIVVLLLPILLPAVFGVALTSLGVLGVILLFALEYWYVFVAAAVAVFVVSYLLRRHGRKQTEQFFAR